ncbi:MAG: carbohydrate ABC transporter permease [Caldilineaceae bacterium]
MAANYGTNQWWKGLAVCLILFFTLAPFVWMMIISITPESGLFTQGVQYVPKDATIVNYVNIFKVINFGRAFANSVIVALATTVLAMSVSVAAGYAFARFNFPGRNFLTVGLLLIYMLPSIVLLIPMLAIFKTFGILNTYTALILAESTHAIPFAVYLLTNFFVTVPRDLDEAALIDGCSRFSALLRVVLPVAIPGVIAAALFVFIASWNNFLFAFMFTSNENVRTLPVLLRGFVGGEAGVFWGQVMAAAVMTTLPVAIVFLVFQRYLIRGLAAGAVKG